MRACLITLAENRLTLAELPPLLTDAASRQFLSARARHEETRQFWQRFETFSPTLQAVYAEPVLTRVNRFLSDPAIKAMLGSSQSLNFPELMDKGAILLVSLPKGQLKDVSLIGSLLLAQLYWAALARLSKPASRRRLFTIYLDEFQNFLTDVSHAEDMLAEVRKCQVGLVMVTQCLAFLDRTLRASALANSSLQVFFRLNPQDAGIVSAELSLANRKAWMQKLLSLPPRQAVVLMRGEGKPCPMRTPDRPSAFDPELIAWFKKTVHRQKGRRKGELLKEIHERHLRLDALISQGGISRDGNGKDGHQSSHSPNLRTDGGKRPAVPTRKPPFPFEEAEPF